MQELCQIRPFHESDQVFLLEVSKRFAQFPLMNWRTKERMEQANYHLAEQATINLNVDNEIYLAVDTTGKRLGYLHIRKQKEFFTQLDQAFILSLVVIEEAQGKGIAQKLMKFAEDWARKRGLEQICLNVFRSNDRAYDLYRYLGYEVETVKMVKELSE
ncbi:GNAT family N-acetyltransferase [Risungbinella massiliensis]|uniref:GNAT family N-acetyltransferase n=1 Tax=Risungbinella massiliensis TaxID=1329796 RepID=UPI00069B5C3D|nr:GNAT family N-acetyltransferase [Risungbinella massiliensis]